LLPSGQLSVTLQGRPGPLDGMDMTWHEAVPPSAGGGGGGAAPSAGGGLPPSSVGGGGGAPPSAGGGVLASSLGGGGGGVPPSKLPPPEPPLVPPSAEGAIVPPELEPPPLVGGSVPAGKQQVAWYPLSVSVQDWVVAPVNRAHGSASAQRGGDAHVVPPPADPLHAAAAPTVVQTGAPPAKQHDPVKPFGPSTQFCSVAPG